MDTDKRYKIKIEVIPMCVALCHPHDKQIIITHFTDVNPKLPIKTQANLQLFLTWGRRLDEKSLLPVGGWIAQELKQKGVFDKYFPKPVKILTTKFMEQDVEGRSCWFDITPGQTIQGYVLREKEESRVYIAVFAPEKPATPFTRWPVILSN